jgi:hypothetical protein
MMIISKDEWLAMRREWLANRDAWLAQCNSLPRNIQLLNPYVYTTLSDGRHHPCDAPDITPKEFFLAVIRDCAIPFDLRIWAAKQLVELFPEHNLSYADYKVACEMMEWLTMERTTVQ